MSTVAALHSRIVQGESETLTLKRAGETLCWGYRKFGSNATRASANALFHARYFEWVLKSAGPQCVLGAE